MTSSKLADMEAQLEELRGKYHLKRKDSEAFRESTQNEIREKEQFIAKLRKDNWNKRILLAHHENGDEHVIKTVFADDQDRLDRLSLQRLTATGAIEEMDQKVCEGGKVLNMLRYGAEQAESILQGLNSELERMVKISKNSPEQDEAETRVTMLENALDKANIKYDTARIISSRYAQILQKLKEESLQLPAKLDVMEQALVAQRRELHELQTLNKDAQLASDTARRTMRQVEQESYENRKKRDAELNKTRKEVERRQTDKEKVERRVNRAALLVNDNQEQQRAAAEEAGKRDLQQRLLAYDDALRRIQEATHVTDMADVIERVQTQQEKQTQLKAQVSELETGTQRLREEVSTLGEQFHHLKFSGDDKMSHGQAIIDELTLATERENERQHGLQEKLARSSALQCDLRTSVGSLLKKLENVKLKPPEHNHTKGDVFDQMTLAQKKLDMLLKQLQNVQQGLAGDDLATAPDFQDYLESTLPQENTRVQLDSCNSRMSDLSELEFDSHDAAEHAPTREDIKRAGDGATNGKAKGSRKRTQKGSKKK